MSNNKDNEIFRIGDSIPWDPSWEKIIADTGGYNRNVVSSFPSRAAFDGDRNNFVFEPEPFFNKPHQLQSARILTILTKANAGGLLAEVFWKQLVSQAMPDASHAYPVTLEKYGHAVIAMFVSVSPEEEMLCLVTLDGEPPVGIFFDQATLAFKKMTRLPNDWAKKLDDSNNPLIDSRLADRTIRGTSAMNLIADKHQPHSQSPRVSMFAGHQKQNEAAFATMMHSAGGFRRGDVIVASARESRHKRIDEQSSILEHSLIVIDPFPKEVGQLRFTINKERPLVPLQDLYKMVQLPLGKLPDGVNKNQREYIDFEALFSTPIYSGSPQRSGHRGIGAKKAKKLENKRQGISTKSALSLPAYQAQQPTQSKRNKEKPSGLVSTLVKQTQSTSAMLSKKHWGVDTKETKMIAFLQEQSDNALVTFFFDCLEWKVTFAYETALTPLMKPVFNKVKQTLNSKHRHPDQTFTTVLFADRATMNEALETARAINAGANGISWKLDPGSPISGYTPNNLAEAIRTDVSQVKSWWPNMDTAKTFAAMESTLRASLSDAAKYVTALCNSGFRGLSGSDIDMLLGKEIVADYKAAMTDHNYRRRTLLLNRGVYGARNTGKLAHHQVVEITEIQKMIALLPKGS